METGFLRFPDHHWYSRDELRALDAQAVAAGADGLVTTEKDWVRLRRLAPAKRPLYVIGVRLELVSGEADWAGAFARVARRR